MKITSSIILLSALSFYSGLSVANEDACPLDAVHCAYVEGLSNNLNDGRYLKITNEYGNFIMCFTSESAVMILQSSAGKFVGKHADVYSMCTDATGKNCQQFDVDNFKITQESAGTYQGTPARFAINVSNVKNNYPACDAFEVRYIKR